MSNIHENNQNLHAKWWANIDAAIQSPPPASDEANYMMTCPWSGNGTLIVDLTDAGAAPGPMTCRVWIEPWNKVYPVQAAYAKAGQTYDLVPQKDSRCTIATDPPLVRGVLPPAGRYCPEIGIAMESGYKEQNPAAWVADTVTLKRSPYHSPTSNSSFIDQWGHPQSTEHMWTYWPPSWEGWQNAGCETVNVHLDHNNNLAFFLGGYIEIMALVEPDANLLVCHKHTHEEKYIPRLQLMPHCYRVHGEECDAGALEVDTGRALYPYSDAYKWGRNVLDDPIKSDYQIDGTWMKLGGAIPNSQIQKVSGQSKSVIKHWSCIPIVPGKHGVMNLRSGKKWVSNQYPFTNYNADAPSTFSLVASVVMPMLPRSGIWVGRSDLPWGNVTNEYIYRVIPDSSGIELLEGGEFEDPPKDVDPTKELELLIEPTDTVKYLDRVVTNCHHHFRESRATNAPIQSLLAGYPYIEYQVQGTPALPAVVQLQINFKLFYHFVVPGRSVNWKFCERGQTCPPNLPWESQYCGGQIGQGPTRQDALNSMINSNILNRPENYGTDLNVPCNLSRSAPTMTPAEEGVYPYVSFRDPNALNKTLFIDGNGKRQRM